MSVKQWCVVYLNGDYVPEAEERISLFDCALRGTTAAASGDGDSCRAA